MWKAQETAVLTGLVGGAVSGAGLTSKGSWTGRIGGAILYSRCLKVGMNPELVDASIRLKYLRKTKQRADDESVLCGSLEPADCPAQVADGLSVSIED